MSTTCCCFSHRCSRKRGASAGPDAECAVETLTCGETVRVWTHGSTAVLAGITVAGSVVVVVVERLVIKERPATTAAYVGAAADEEVNGRDIAGARTLSWS